MKPIEALNRLREFGLSFAIYQSFSAACRMGIFELLVDGPATVSVTRNWGASSPRSPRIV